MVALRGVAARGGVGLAAAAVLVVFLLLPGAASGASTSFGSASAIAGGDALSLGSFAERAGFNASMVNEIASPQISTAEGQVEISFAPSSSSFYEPPSVGAPAMTVAEIADEWGLSPAAYAAAESYFEREGLSVQHAWPDRLSLTLSGSAPAIDRAFSTTLLTGEYSGRSVQYPAVAPALPAWLQGEVDNVAGLSTGFTAFHLPLLPAVPIGLAPKPSLGSDPNLVTPAIARQIYQVSNLYNYTGSTKFATGETIVLLLWGDGWSPSDLSTFYSSDYPSSFPSVTVTPFPIDGAPAPSANAVNDPSDAPQELTLDLEWSGSIAPGASLDAVYAPDGPASDQYSPSVSSMTDALNEAVTGISGVDAISMSFGTAEGSGGGLASAWANDISEATHRDITLLGATGDLGGDAGNGCTGGPQPQYPAADPYVIAVGGTNPTLATNPLGQVTGIASETAWSMSGGGFSTEYAAPSWQLVGSAAAPISATGHRGMPDVSAAAATDFVYYAGSDRSGSGTSFATPLWAGLVAEMDALHGSPLGFITPNLYSIGAAEPAGHIPISLADIISGSNCLGPAGPGWDSATGWGSPRGEALFADLTATLVNLTLVAAPSPVGPGATLTLTVHVANESSGAPIGNLPVLVTVTGDTSIGPCEGVFGSSNSPTNASGFVTVSVTVPGCYLGSKAVVNAQVTSAGLYGMQQLLVPVNLLGYFGALGPLAEFPGDIVLYALIMAAAVAVGAVLGRGPREGPPPTEPPPPGPPPTSAPLAPAREAGTTLLPPSPPPSPAAEPPPPAALSPGPSAGDVPSEERT